MLLFTADELRRRFPSSALPDQQKAVAELAYEVTFWNLYLLSDSQKSAGSTLLLNKCPVKLTWTNIVGRVFKNTFHIFYLFIKNFVHRLHKIVGLNSNKYGYNFPRRGSALRSPIPVTSPLQRARRRRMMEWQRWLQSPSSCSTQWRIEGYGKLLDTVAPDYGTLVYLRFVLCAKNYWIINFSTVTRNGTCPRSIARSTSSIRRSSEFQTIVIRFKCSRCQSLHPSIVVKKHLKSCTAVGKQSIFAHADRWSLAGTLWWSPSPPCSIWAISTRVSPSTRITIPREGTVGIR